MCNLSDGSGKQSAKIDCILNIISEAFFTGVLSSDNSIFGFKWFRPVSGVGWLNKLF